MPILNAEYYKFQKYSIPIHKNQCLVPTISNTPNNNIKETTIHNTSSNKDTLNKEPEVSVGEQRKDLHKITTNLELNSTDGYLNLINIILEKSFNQEEIPNYFNTGVYFYDLIKRIEGKSFAEIKGIIRNNLNKTQKLLNIKKVLNYLSGFEKFNKRHIYNENLIYESNNVVIWGLLEDIFSFYGVKKIKEIFKEKPKKLKVKEEEEVSYNLETLEKFQDNSVSIIKNVHNHFNSGSTPKNVNYKLNYNKSINNLISKNKSNEVNDKTSNTTSNKR